MPGIVTINTRQYRSVLNRMQRSLSSDQLNKASTRAINYALARAKTGYKKEIRNIYNIKAGDASNIPIVKRASYAKPEGTISGQTKPLSLSRFATVFSRGTVTTFKAVKNSAGKKTLTARTRNSRSKNKTTVEIIKGQPEQIGWAFLIKGNSNGALTQIWGKSEQKYSEGPFAARFKRLQSSGSDTPISPLKTASPFNTLTKNGVMTPVSILTQDNYTREFIRQADLLLQNVIR